MTTHLFGGKCSTPIDNWSLLIFLVPVYRNEQAENSKFGLDNRVLKKARTPSCSHFGRRGPRNSKVVTFRMPRGFAQSS